MRLAGDFLIGEGDVRQVVRPRHGVIAEAGGQTLAAIGIVDTVFQKRLSDALRHAAMHLPRHQHRIDDAAEIIQHMIGHDIDLAGFGINLHLTDMAAIGECGRRTGEQRIAVEPVFIARDLFPLQRDGEFGKRDAALAFRDTETAYRLHHLECHVAAAGLQHLTGRGLALFDHFIRCLQQRAASHVE